MSTHPSILINFAEAHNVGHLIEALRYAAGHRAASPDARIGLVVHADTPHELARYAGVVDEVHTVPMYGDPVEVRRALADIPRRWDHVLDNVRRHQPAHSSVVPGFARYYELSDGHFTGAVSRGVAGIVEQRSPGYVPHVPVRLDLPATAIASARRRLAGHDGAWVALLPAGSGPAALYPDAGSWAVVVDELRRRRPGTRFVLVGRHVDDGRTTSSTSRHEVEQLLDLGMVDAFDLPITEQLALVGECDLFTSTHSGFGWAASTVGTPWLTIAGGRWPEVFFNDVPFVSVLPDPDRFGRYSLYDEPPTVDDVTGARSPHVTRARFDADRTVIGDAAETLIDQRIDVETAMRDHFARTAAFLGPHREALFSIDRIHERYLRG